MATILVSFVGTGFFKGDEHSGVSKTGYEPVEYLFDNGSKETTTVFGSALLKYLKKTDVVDAWLIMGTPQSIWCDLVAMFGDQEDEIIESTDEIFEVWVKLKDEAITDYRNGTKQSTISSEDLNVWQEVLSDNLADTKVICRLVGDATEANSQNKIFSALSENINEGDKVVFDVTHGLRNQPIITSFVLMYLRYLKDITDIKFYYGAKDLDGKVIPLDFCNELLKATEAVAIYEQTGNYEQIGKQIKPEKSFTEKLNSLVYSEEMHRLNKGLAKTLINEIPKKNIPLQDSLSEKLVKALGWSDKKSLADRLKERAVDLFNKGQYFKATASLFESILVANCIKNNIFDLDDYSERNKAKDRLTTHFSKSKESFEKYSKFETIIHLRNAILHSSATDNPRIVKAINDFAEFEKIFKEGLKIYEDVKSQKI